MKPVRFLSPTFPPAELIAADYAAMLRRGVFSNGGPLDRQFTAEVEDWVGQGVRAATVANCTAGIELAIRATFHSGRRLAIVPSFTFAAGPLAIVNCGYQPVFVDIDAATWQPRVAGAAQFLADRAEDVAGILLTTTFGVADPAVEEWEQLAARFGLPLVIDSAAGFGSLHPDGRPTGAHGSCQVFSMHATKVLAVGEGGLITSRDTELIARLEMMKNFGFDKERRSMMAGTNCKLPELTAAIGSRQLAALPERLARRRNVVRQYMDSLRPLGIAFQPGADRSAPAFVSVLLPDGSARDALRAALERSAIECRDYYNPPAHRQPFFTDALVPLPLVNTDAVAARVLALPMADDLPAEVPLRTAELARGVLHD